jgi:excisionase family DNA binding protein
LGNEKFREELRELIMNNFFTVNELAKHFRVNPKTIYRRLWAKGIPAFKVGRSWRIAKKDLVWLKR